MCERLTSSVVRGDYYAGEVNIICCKRGGTIMWERLISSFVRGTIMWERLTSSVVRGDYYVGEVNIICCKRGLLCGEVNIICCKS